MIFPFCNSSIFFWTSFSLSLSKAEVASSNNKISGFFKNALAIANLCFSPPETGFSLVSISLFIINFSIEAFLTASITSVFDASNFPYKIFSYILLLNNTGSWLTNPIFFLNSNKL